MGVLQSHKAAARSPSPWSPTGHTQCPRNPAALGIQGLREDSGPGLLLAPASLLTCGMGSHPFLCPGFPICTGKAYFRCAGLQSSFSSDVLPVKIRKWVVFVSEAGHVPSPNPSPRRVWAASAPPPALWVNSTPSWGKPFVFLDLGDGCQWWGIDYLAHRTRLMELVNS